jgi:long-chain acyl-CoA synthetase
MQEVTMTRAQAIAELTAPGQEYELVDGNSFGRPCLTFKNGPKTLRELFEDNLSDETFIVYGDERLTYNEAHAAAAKIATVLVEQYDIQPGDRVAISMRNFPEWILCFCAITSIDAIAVAMNALWTADEMAYGLNDSGAKVLFADQERLVNLAKVVDDVSVQTIAVRPQTDTPYPQIDDLIAACAAETMPDRKPDEQDIATLFYTSGSTGHPKGVASSHLNIVSALLSWELDAQASMLSKGIEAAELPYQSATLLAVPLFHVTGSHAAFLQSFRVQRKIVAMYKWDPALGAELIEREQISSFMGPAAMTGDLVQEARRTSCDLSTLLSVGGGGAPRAPEQVHNIEEAFDQAMPGTGWGMTETNAIGTGIGGQDYLDRPASSGRCSPVLQLKVINEDGVEVPSGERGELLIRGTSIFQGYWNRPDANAEVFEDDGWMRTGDVAYLDEEGFLFIVDRTKDLVIRGGENIGCGEVEAALLAHPVMLEASVYAVPDERLGEEVGATLYTQAPLKEDELRAFLESRLARFQIPRYIQFSSEPLPRTASGKIFKRQLREEAAERLGA